MTAGVSAAAGASIGSAWLPLRIPARAFPRLDHGRGAGGDSLFDGYGIARGKHRPRASGLVDRTGPCGCYSARRRGVDAARPVSARGLRTSHVCIASGENPVSAAKEPSAWIRAVIGGARHFVDPCQFLSRRAGSRCGHLRRGFHHFRPSRSGCCRARWSWPWFRAGPELSGMSA